MYMWSLSQNHAFRAFEYQVEAQEHVLENPEHVLKLQFDVQRFQMHDFGSNFTYTYSNMV